MQYRGLRKRFSDHLLVQERIYRGKKKKPGPKTT